MNMPLVIRLLAVALSVSSGVRVLAQSPRDAETISFRTMTLDLMEKNVREASLREEARAARKTDTAPASTLSAARFDLNNDGKLDEAEFVTWTGAVRQAAVKSPDAMKRFDLNKDGQLDDREWASASTALFGR